MLRLALLAAGAVTLAPIVAAAECADDPDRVGSCRAVHGRLFFSNGAPSARIWIVGTRRILGVTGRREASLPDYLQRQLSWEAPLYGDYWVCPLFNPPRQGHMEFVCIHSWRNLVRTDEDKKEAVATRVPTGPAPPWPGGPE